ncbi:MAG: hypothetical protein HOF95_03170 [Rhodospirillales bacterium]|jgi:phospholipase/carboxylesterase|nr:hypothetical protein [Rhodospirillales bacterium]MBT4006723.1 hypothetical protein [Rhodospirillales bacterium]MBT5114001.1 hypothetical protein [Rhodospirillales bacterium]MBT5672529.1 hypothetical protein [Rhodospirillales bacterium]MBT6185802.1 hypothetical protein [Rhodospirillales bacterium]
MTTDSPRTLLGPDFGPPSGDDPQWLVVFLHGFGSDGQDLISLGPIMGEALPHARFIAPNGPEACDMAPADFTGRQWFNLADRSSENMEAGVRRAAIDLDAYLDGELARLKLDDSRLILVGFSQGAMTALHVGLRRENACAGILSMSGALIAPETLPGEIKSRPPVCIIHGREDDVVPVVSADTAQQLLTRSGVSVDCHLLEELGHGIDDAALILAVSFLGRITAHSA